MNAQIFIYTHQLLDFRQNTCHVNSSFKNDKTPELSQIPWFQYHLVVPMIINVKRVK